MPPEQERSDVLPDGLRQWVDDRADSTERSPIEVLARAVMAYRLLEEGNPTAGLDAEIGNLDSRIDDLERQLDSRIDGLERQLDSMDVHEELSELETAIESDIEDIRQRVVDVLTEAKSKADVDHEHPQVDERVEAVAEELGDVDESVGAIDDRLSEIETSVTALESSVTAIDELESTVSTGFENYETILEAIDETTVELSSKTATLAKAVVSMRKRLDDLERRRAIDRITDEFKREANKKGIDTGQCEECGHKVNVGLLSVPRCPHCESRFSGVDRGWRFIGRATLQTEPQPALEGEIEELTATRTEAEGAIDRLAGDGTVDSVLRASETTETQDDAPDTDGDTTNTQTDAPDTDDDPADATESVYQPDDDTGTEKA